MNEGDSIGPVPRRKTVQAVNIGLRPDQVDALNYLAGEQQFDSLAKAVRLVVDYYFERRLAAGVLPDAVAESVREGLANR